MTNLAQIQMPALVAGAALLIEGVAALSPLAGLFQVVPILVSFASVYFAWSGGYYFLAFLYALGGCLAFGAFFSVRLIANIPAIGIYLLIIFLPRVHEGPQGDLFSTMQVPTYPMLASVLLALVIVGAGVRFAAPRVFLLAVIALAVALTATTSEMFSTFGWVPLQRGISFFVGVAVLVIGYLYYHAALGWTAYRARPRREESQESVGQDAQLQESLTQWLVELEEFRKRNGYRSSWLQAIAREAGIETLFESLVQEGRLVIDQRTSTNQSIGPRALVKSVGLGSDPAELLAVSRSANLEEIKESYQRIASFFHHDRINQLSPEAQKLARKVAVEISKAYRVLSKT